MVSSWEVVWADASKSALALVFACVMRKWDCCIVNWCSLVTSGCGMAYCDWMVQASRGSPYKLRLKHMNWVVWGKLTLLLPVLYLSRPPAKMIGELDGLGWYKMVILFGGREWLRHDHEDLFHTLNASNSDSPHSWDEEYIPWHLDQRPCALVFPWSCNHLYQWQSHTD